MKSVSAMFSVDATRPPTFTVAPLPNSIPFVFTRNTLPLAESLPRIAEGSDPITRFKATEALPGCLNCTASPAAMPKPCQLMMALLLPCVMVVCVPLVLMAAEPAATTPPTGPACAGPASDSMMEQASTAWAKGGREPAGCWNFIVFACSEVLDALDPEAAGAVGSGGRRIVAQLVRIERPHQEVVGRRPVHADAGAAQRAVVVAGKPGIVVGAHAADVDESDQLHVSRHARRQGR